MDTPIPAHSAQTDHRSGLARSPQRPSPSRDRNVAIQWLRAFAATEVVLWHSDLLTKTISHHSIHSSFYAPFGGIGVETFFIVSGFLMSLVTSSTVTVSGFAISRLRRIVPLYWAFTTLVIVAFLLHSRWRLSAFDLDLGTLLHSYLVLPQNGFPILMVGWTLEFEIVFYVLVTLFVAVAGPRTISAKVGFGAFLAILGLLGSLLSASTAGHPWLTHTLSPYMFAFAIGWLLASVAGPSRMMLVAAALCLGVPFVIALAAEIPAQRMELVRIAVAAILVAAVLALRGLLARTSRIGRLITLIGEASYSLYLSHWFVMSIGGKLIGELALPAAAAAPVRIVGVGIAILVGLAFYVLIERSLDGWLRRISGDGPSRIATAAVSTLVVRPRQMVHLSGPIGPDRR